ncbi:nucleosidase [Corynebacterium diphtheriae]|nr:nucleosidase [Corynebacterium diphtheriae]
MAWLGLAGVGGRWWALVGVGGRATPRSPPKKTALHTKSAQTAGLEAIWCEVSRKILRNTPV